MTKQRPVFNPKTFLSTIGPGRQMMSFRKGQKIFAQGDTANAVFVIQTGSVRLSAKSQSGKEARSTSWARRTLLAKIRLPVGLFVRRLPAH